MKQVLLASLLIGMLTSAGHAQQPANLRKAIEANNKAFVESFNQGNAGAIAEMYTSDALLLPPNNPIIVGHQGIREFWQNLITAGLKAVRLETERVEACGDTAYEVGYYTLTIPTATGGTVTDQGKYIVVWKREGPKWKLARDIWNTSARPAS
jgi:ketosteroid isomerase-like protein